MTLVAGIAPAAPVQAADSRLSALTRPGLANRLKNQNKTPQAPNGKTSAAAAKMLANPKAAATTTQPKAYPVMERTSVTNAGDEVAGDSYITIQRGMSGDSRYVIFMSSAQDLTQSGDNGMQIFVRDRQSGTTELISRNNAGEMGNASSFQAVISTDGRYVAYVSFADNLVSDDTNGTIDGFVYDRVAQKTERISLSSAGVQANEGTEYVSISADGRYVAFTTAATNLVKDVTDSMYAQVYVYDRQTHQTELVSRNSQGKPADGLAEYGAISGDGRYVTFQSNAPDLDGSGHDGTQNIYVRDRVKGTTQRVSFPTFEAFPGAIVGEYPSINADGTKISYQSEIPTDTGMGIHAFVRDLTAKQTVSVDQTAAGDQLTPDSNWSTVSGDGKSVAFVSADAVYVRDLKTGALRLASADAFNRPANGPSGAPSLSTDGRYVAFSSTADNLVPDDTNGTWDVFVSGPDVTPPSIGLYPWGSPGVRLYAYDATEDTFYFVGAGVGTAGSITVPTGLTKADGWVLEGYTTEPLSKAIINKKPVDVADDGFSFALEIPAPTTKAVTYSLEMYDLAGNKGTSSIQTIQDQTPPHTTITSPSPAIVAANGLLKLTGTADEPLYWAELYMQDGDKWYPVDDYLFSVNGTSFTILAIVPSAGKYWVRGMNGAGEEPDAPDRSSKDVRDVVIDTEAPATPQFTTPAPVDGAIRVNVKNPTIKGITEPYATVKGDLPESGQPSALGKADKNGNFTLTFAGIPEGEYDLALTATDTVGNAADYSVPFVVDLTAPAVQSVSLWNDTTSETVSPFPASGNTYAFGLNAAMSGTVTVKFSEPVKDAKVNKATKGVQVSDAVVTFPTGKLTAAATTFAVTATDLAGNPVAATVTIKIDTKAPTVTLSSPAGDVVVGAAGGLPTVTFSGTADEDLSTMELWELQTGADPIRIEPVTTTLNGARGAWTVQISLGPVDAVHRYYVVGVDLAGNRSAANLSKGVRTVTVDAAAPVLSFTQEPGFVNGLFTATYSQRTTLTLKGSLHDDVGLSQLLIGATKVLPGTSSPKDIPINNSVTLTEGLNDLTIVGTDKAGNKSDAYRILALVKTQISSLTAKATITTDKQAMVISGTVDKAVMLNGQLTGVVPIHIVVTRYGSKDLVGDFTLSEPSGVYNPLQGTFKGAVDMSGWPAGKYTVTVTGLAPAEFSSIAAKTVTMTVSKTK